MTWEGLNRRKFPRAKFPCIIKIVHEKDRMETILTHTENISIGGVCVIIKRYMEIFSSVSVELDLMDGGDIIACPGKVVWTVRRKAAEELKPSFYDTGIEFLALDASDQARLTDTVKQLVQTGHEAKYR
jgi:Tfp pilus assembly protein PilZ